jgi:hypothetical protein
MATTNREARDFQQQESVFSTVLSTVLSARSAAEAV